MLLIYDYIAHVMSILSVHITDVYRLYTCMSGNIIFFSFDCLAEPIFAS